MKIYITRKLPEAIVEKLSAEFDVSMWEESETVVPREILFEKVKEVDGLLCMLTETIDRKLLETAPNLKVISNMAVGYNNIDIEAATEKGIAVTNTPGVLTETTADLTFTLLMATARRVVEASQYLREGKWKTWSPLQLTGMDIHGATLGIIGLGRIGEAVARRAKGFNMHILYNSRTRKKDKEQELGIYFAELETLLRESDYICLLLPYSKDVHHLISLRELAMMKKTAVLINTARGGIVDENALYDALAMGTIWAAGLDVFEKEPVDPAHPLLTLPNVVTLPHIGSASVATRMKMASLAADNVINELRGVGKVMRVN